jgi:hypothetical protein
MSYNNLASRPVKACTECKQAKVPTKFNPTRRKANQSSYDVIPKRGSPIRAHDATRDIYSARLTPPLKELQQESQFRTTPPRSYRIFTNRMV